MRVPRHAFRSRHTFEYAPIPLPFAYCKTTTLADENKMLPAVILHDEIHPLFLDRPVRVISRYCYKWLSKRR